MVVDGLKAVLQWPPLCSYRASSFQNWIYTSSRRFDGRSRSFDVPDYNVPDARWSAIVFCIKKKHFKKIHSMLHLNVQYMQSIKEMKNKKNRWLTFFSLFLVRMSKIWHQTICHCSLFCSFTTSMLRQVNKTIKTSFQLF